jgi:hypothetical protein
LLGSGAGLGSCPRSVSSACLCDLELSAVLTRRSRETLPQGFSRRPGSHCPQSCNGATVAAAPSPGTCTLVSVRPRGAPVTGDADLHLDPKPGRGACGPLRVCESLERSGVPLIFCASGPLHAGNNPQVVRVLCGMSLGGQALGREHGLDHESPSAPPSGREPSAGPGGRARH